MSSKNFRKVVLQMEFPNFYKAKRTTKCVMSVLVYFTCIFLILLHPETVSVEAIANSYYDPSIIFPGEKLESLDFGRVHQNSQFYHHKYKLESKISEQIVFPTDSESERPQNGNYRPRPYVYSLHSTSRKKPALDYPYRRPSADSTSTYVQKPAKYFPYVPQEESDSLELLTQSKALNTKTHFKTLTKRLPTSERAKPNPTSGNRGPSSPNENTEEKKSKELLSIFLRWVEKCAPLSKTSSKLNENSSSMLVKKNGTDATSYSLDAPLNDTKCPDGLGPTQDGECKPTVKI